MTRWDVSMQGMVELEDTVLADRLAKAYEVIGISRCARNYMYRLVLLSCVGTVCVGLPLNQGEEIRD